MAASQYHTALEEAVKVVKRQKTCEVKVNACLDDLIEMAQRAHDALTQQESSSGAPADSILSQLSTSVEQAFKEANSQTKELHSAVGKLGKLLDKMHEGKEVDITGAMRDVPMDMAVLDKVIAEHLFREGRFEAGFSLVREAHVGASQGEALAAPFTTIHQVLSQMQRRNLEPALQWATAQALLLRMGSVGVTGAAAAAAAGAGAGGSGSASGSSKAAGAAAAQQQQQLRQQVPQLFKGAGGGGGTVPQAPGIVVPGAGVTSNSAGPSSKQPILGISGQAANNPAAWLHAFTFRLHSLNFLTTLLDKGQAAALAYARTHFGSYRSSQMKDIQRLMACLVYCRPAAAAAAGAGGSGSGGDVVMADTQQHAQPQQARPGAHQAGAQNGGAQLMAAEEGGTSTSSASGTAAASGAALTLEGTPYACLVNARAWEDAAAEFSRLACSLMGLPAESPLAVVLAAGAAALLPLLKLTVLMEKNSNMAVAAAAAAAPAPPPPPPPPPSSLTAGAAAAIEAAAAAGGGTAPMPGLSGPGAADDVVCWEQLPVELELGAEFVFHPIFACPVSREQSSPQNPPQLLPCGHVLCEQSVLKIAKTRTRVFKCPYCPVEARADNLRTLIFPPPAD